MPTAFRATFGKGKPVIATYAEYDAVPGNSQDPVPYEKPRDGVHQVCRRPHRSAFGAWAGRAGRRCSPPRPPWRSTSFPARWSSSASRRRRSAARSRCMRRMAITTSSTPRSASTPPSPRPMPTRSIWDTHCGSYWSRMYSFECPHPEEWAGMGLNEGASAHTSARAPGAIDAVCLMYMTQQDDQGGDAAAYRHLDHQRGDPRRRPGDRRQSRPQLQPDPICQPLPDAGDAGADLRHPRQQCRPCGEDHPLHGAQGMGDQDPARACPTTRSPRSTYGNLVLGGRAALGRGGEEVRPRDPEQPGADADGRPDRIRPWRSW